MVEKCRGPQAEGAQTERSVMEIWNHDSWEGETIDGSGDELAHNGVV
jgi:hypothetical protein